MTDYFYLIPIALGIGLAALAAFMWSLKNGQYDDCLLYTSDAADE